MRRHTVTALAAAGVLLAGACNGSGDGGETAARSRGPSRATTSERFCDSAKALYDRLLSAGTTDPSSSAARSEFAEARNLVAPAAIAKDWNEVLDTLEPLVTGEVDMSDPSAMETFADRTAGAATAFQRTGAYFEQQCGFGPATTTSALAPTGAPDGVDVPGAADAALGTVSSGAPASAP